MPAYASHGFNVMGVTFDLASVNATSGGMYVKTIQFGQPSIMKRPEEFKKDVAKIAALTHWCKKNPNEAIRTICQNAYVQLGSSRRRETEVLAKLANLAGYMKSEAEDRLEFETVLFVGRRQDYGTKLNQLRNKMKDEHSIEFASYDRILDFIRNS